MDRRRILSVLRLAVAAALIAVLARHVDLRGALGVLGRINPLWLVPVALLVLTGTVLSSFRWQLALTRILGIDVALPTLIRLYFIGMFVNLGLPTTAGGDVVRAEMMRGLTGGRGGAYASILADRLIGAIAVVLLAGGAAVAAHGALDFGTRAFAGLALAAAILGVGALAFGLRRFAGRGGASRLSAFTDALALMTRRPGILAISLTVALVVQVVAVVLPVALLARATGIDVPLSVHLRLVPLIVLATLIPVAPNGLGLRETAFVLLYSRFGVPPESAAALGFAWSLTLTALGMIGGLLFATWAAKPVPAAPPAQPRGAP